MTSCGSRTRAHRPCVISVVSVAASQVRSFSFLDVCQSPDLEIEQMLMIARILTAQGSLALIDDYARITWSTPSHAHIAPGSARLILQADNNIVIQSGSEVL
jgi:hypothetical protein